MGKKIDSSILCFHQSPFVSSNDWSIHTQDFNTYTPGHPHTYLVDGLLHRIVPEAPAQVHNCRRSYIVHCLFDSLRGHSHHDGPVCHPSVVHEDYLTAFSRNGSQGGIVTDELGFSFIMLVSLRGATRSNCATSRLEQSPGVSTRFLGAGRVVQRRGKRLERVRKACSRFGRKKLEKKRKQK